MSDYEITYIATPTLDETARGALDADVDAKIADLKGSIGYHSPNLRRRLAYAIEKQGNAFVRTVQIELDPSRIATIHQLLKKNSGILRFSILQTSRREEANQEIIDRYSRRKDTKAPTRKPMGQTAAPKEAKEVTMQDVEKGIEEALHEEIK